MPIDLDRELLYIGVEYFDMLRTITSPSRIKKIWNSVVGKATIFNDSNVKEFGAEILQEMDRLGIGVVILVRTTDQIATVKEIISKSQLLVGVECCLVTPANREYWALGRGAQFVKSYEDLRAIMSHVTEAEVEEWDSE